MAVTNVNQIGVSAVKFSADGKTVIIPLDGFLVFGAENVDGSVRCGVISGVFTVQTLTGGTWETDFEAI